MTARILIVEDDPASLELGRYLLDAADFDAYHSKPITPDTFVAEVVSLLPPDTRAGRPS